MNMIKCIVKTNLDLFNEEWPCYFPCIPRVGEIIKSKTLHPQYKKDKNGFCLGGMPTHFVSIELEVVSIKYVPIKQNDKSLDKCNVVIELHDKSYLKRSLYDFYKWYAAIVNKSVSAFI